MRYPMWRRNIDGTEFVVNGKAEAYANAAMIDRFLPDRIVPEHTANDEPEAPDGMQDEEDRTEEEVTESEPAAKKRGRPKNVAT